MKKFILRTGLFSLISIVFIESISAFFLFSNLYLINYPGKEIYISIEKSKKKNKSKILLLGDSVGRQIFNNNQNFDRINSLACNQGISLAGQYFLLHNYLETGNKIDKLIILYNPLSFRNNLDQIYTYHYFLKPFYNSNYISLFSSTAKTQIQKIPYYKYAKLPHIKVTSWAPDFVSKDPQIKSLLSPISIEYLNKIKKLSNQYSFEIIVLSPPVNFEKKNEIEKLNLDVLAEFSLRQEFEEYLSNINYMNNTEFNEDGIHLINPGKYTKTLIDEIIK